MRVGFLASHGATSARAIWAAAERGEIDVDPCVLICNSGAQALSWARSVALESRHLSGRTHPDPAELHVTIADTLERVGVELVALSGYMKKLGPRTLARFPNRILNIPPGACLRTLELSLDGTIDLDRLDGGAYQPIAEDVGYQ